jgi:hypothetical protein
MEKEFTGLRTDIQNVVIDEINDVFPIEFIDQFFKKNINHLKTLGMASYFNINNFNIKFINIIIITTTITTTATTTSAITIL